MKLILLSFTITWLFYIA